jgi:hypothetical protein
MIDYHAIWFFNDLIHRLENSSDQLVDSFTHICYTLSSYLKSGIPLSSELLTISCKFFNVVFGFTQKSTFMIYSVFSLLSQICIKLRFKKDDILHLIEIFTKFSLKTVHEALNSWRVLLKHYDFLFDYFQLDYFIINILPSFLYSNDESNIFLQLDLLKFF